jgi:hypothetical protein
MSGQASWESEAPVVNHIAPSAILSTGSVLRGSLAEDTYAIQEDSKLAEVSTPATLKHALSSLILLSLEQTKGGDRWSEWRTRQARGGPDDVDQ